MQTKKTDKSAPTHRPKKTGGWRSLCKIVLPLIVLASGLVIASYVYSTAPEAKRKRPPEKAPLVLVERVSRATRQVMIPAMGTVIPAREIALKAQVSGTIQTMDAEFITGGVFKANDKIAAVDSKDYDLAVVQMESQVADARYALKLEMGQQDVAKQEWKLLNGSQPVSDEDAELALRKPHLAKARADLAAAKAELDQARINRERTKVKAPFNCIVMAKHVDLGSFVSNQDEIATLVGTDEYWVQAAVPVDRLKWIAIPRTQKEIGATARIIYGTNGKSPKIRTGRVIRLLADLEEAGRMAQILISVKDPLDLQSTGSSQSPLLIGEYVRVEIEGPLIAGVISVPRSAVRDGDKVWTAGNDGTLDVRTVDIVWRDDDTVVVKKGLNDGDRLILSDLSAPVPGMKVLVQEESDRAATPIQSSGKVEGVCSEG